VPVEVYEDSLELQVGLLEAVVPETREEFGGCYPYPPLRSLDRQEKRAFRTAVLENDHLKATFLPDLGGRLLSLLDKSTNTEVLPRNSILRPTFDSVRHAGIPDGLQITLDGRDRLNSMGSVSYAAEPGDEIAGLWFAEAAGPISWHAHWQLAEDRAELILEVRAFNRTLVSRPYTGGLLVWNPGARLFSAPEGFVIWNDPADSGLAIWEDGAVLSGASQMMGQSVISRAPQGFQLAPRQMDSYKLTLVPFSKIGEPVAASKAVLMGRNTPKVSLRVPGILAKGKMVLLTHDGQTLEAATNLDAGSRFEAELPQNVAEIAVLDAEKNTLLRHSLGSSLDEVAMGDPEPFTLLEQDPFDAEATPRTLLAQTLHPSLKSPANTALALHACREGRFNAASDALEQALLHNGEDHLNWWLKAVLQRLLGESGEEQPELLNAHYLAPLEPSLRAESFLSQPMAGGMEANPILNPLRDTPEAFIEVGCLLLSVGLYQEANRWLDEALRHVDLAMLRYLQAFTLMQGSRMQTDAASQVAAGGRLPFGPPFPWREIESRALSSLLEAFPQDEILRKYAVLSS
jgi:tetratricopeptide (TPR) repeat protein